MTAFGITLTLAACGTSKIEETQPITEQPLWAQSPESRAAQLAESTQPTTEPAETVPTIVPVETEPTASETEAATEPTVPETEAPTEPQPEYEMEEKFSPVDETVYTTDRPNARSQANTDSISYGRVPKGTKLHRVGTSPDGWSAVIYEDQFCYIASEYLTTDAEEAPTEVPEEERNRLQETVVDDQVYTVSDVNMREGPGFDKAVLGRIPAFTELHRVASYNSGFDKVIYKDKEVYVSADYLTAKHPSEYDLEVAEETANDTVFTTQEVNFRKAPRVESGIYGRIPQGTELNRIAITENGWAKVSYDGHEGYISGDFITTTAP